MQDEHGATSSSTLTITVTGTNDAAVIVGDTAKEIFEDADPNLVTGALIVTDLDDGENHFEAVAAGDLVGEYGTFTFDESSGEWSYAVDNSNATVNGLGSGAFLIDTLTVTSHDGTSQTITVTINGVDDVVVATPPLPFDGIGDPNDNDTSGPAAGSTVTNSMVSGVETWNGTNGADSIDGGEW